MSDKKKDSTPKNSHRDLWNVGVSALLVPWINDLVKRIAAATPTDSPLRNPVILRVADGLFAFLEDQTDKIPNPLLAALAEKAVNGMEFLSGTLSGKVEIEKHPRADKDVRVDAVMKVAEKTILEAKTPEEVKDALDLANQKLQALRDFAKKAQPCDPEAVSQNQCDKEERTSSKVVKNLAASFGSLAGRIDAAADRRRRF